MTQVIAALVLVLVALTSPQATAKDAVCGAVAVDSKGVRMTKESDTAACLTKCKQDFDRCSDGGTKNHKDCLEKRKKCYDACK